MSKLGDEIRRHRDRLELSRRVVAKRAKMSYEFFNKMERGGVLTPPNPRVRTLQNLARALRADPMLLTLRAMEDLT